MINFFNIAIPSSLLVLGFFDTMMLFATVAAGLGVHVLMTDGTVVDIQASFQWQAISYATAIMTCLYIMGCYDRTFLLRPRFAILRMLASFALAALTLALTTWAFPQAQMPGDAQAVCMGLSLFTLSASRDILKRIADLPFWKSRVMILGTGEQARRIEELERNHQAAGFLCLGFVATDDDGGCGGGYGGGHGGGCGGGSAAERPDRVIRTTDLVSTYKRLKADEIVLAGDARGDARLREMLLQARLKGLRVIDAETLMERELGQLTIDNAYPDWLLFSQKTCQSRMGRAGKRVFDIAASLTLLTLTAPLMALTAVAVWLEDRGPILYRQERVGLNGTTFHVLKFRSMRIDAEKDGVARWAAVKDPRVTLVGSFIRKVRIDELPQVINVLRGEMSFVGPRPERPSIVADLAQEIESYSYRHIVKPGITGWAQVNYPYGASIEDAKQKLKFDLYYVKNHSILLDLIIMLQTVRVVLWPDGAR